MFRHRQGCPLSDVVQPVFSLPTTTSPTLQGELKGDFGEAAVACDMPEPCKFPSLDSVCVCGGGPGVDICVQRSEFNTS